LDQKDYILVYVKYFIIWLFMFLNISLS